MTPSYDGTVVRRPFAEGSKSERDAVVLATQQGDYLLRRLGGNPFEDPVLDGLVGRSFRFDGELRGSTLIVTDWTEIGEATSRDVPEDEVSDSGEPADTTATPPADPSGAQGPGTEDQEASAPEA